MKRQGKWRTYRLRVYPGISSPVQCRGYLNIWAPRVETNPEGYQNLRKLALSQIVTGSEALLTNKKQCLNFSFLTRLAAGSKHADQLHTQSHFK